jgi:hypothetical protein
MIQSSCETKLRPEIVLLELPASRVVTELTLPL